jgi:hypothetical protein
VPRAGDHKEETWERFHRNMSGPCIRKDDIVVSVHEIHHGTTVCEVDLDLASVGAAICLGSSGGWDVALFSSLCLWKML